MDQKIRPKPKRAGNVVYGDVQEAEGVVYPIPDVIEEIPVVNKECNPEDPKPISD